MAPSGLQIAPDLELPLELVTEPIGIIANRGRGKTYSAHALVEEIYDAGVPVVVLDVKGDWWGLRSSADGKHDGLPFYIFGGDHADLPLEPTAGELLADLVVDERVSVVLDMSHLSKTKARSFTVAFAERLYHRNRDPLFVVVDEADVLIPQRATSETARLMGAMEDIAKRGRGRGLGMAVVTQRPQEVAKSVLDLMDTLVLLGMTGPRSLKSVREWTSVHVDEDRPGWSVIDTLPTLPVGTAWVWSPMHDLQQKVKVRALRTYDSHVTPKPGQKRTAPKARADLDLEALGERITATVDRAKADDPRLLRRRIAELEEQLAQKPAATVEVVTVPILPEETKAELEAIYDRFSLSATEWAEQLAAAVEEADRIVDMSHSVRALIRQAVSDPSTPGADSGAPTLRAPQQRRAPRGPGGEPSSRPGVEAPQNAGEVKLGKTERKVITVLAIHGPSTHSQICMLAGYSTKASTVGVALGKLRKAGYVDEGQPVAATDAGLDWLGDYDPLPSGPELVDYWRKRFGLTEERVLDALIELYPDAGSQPLVCEMTGYSPTASTVGVAAGKLRKVGVIDGWRLNDDFAAAAGLS